MRKYNTTNSHLLICLVLLIPTMLLAQPSCQIRHFSIYNGLAQRTVSDIVQDSKGFIWFSTWNGLNRYDGYTFKNYKAYPGDGCTLTSNRILRIVPDQQNNIWCQTYDARVYLFDSHQEKFIDIRKRSQFGDIGHLPLCMFSLERFLRRLLVVGKHKIAKPRTLLFHAR